jgi:hypothetical protein
MAERASYNGLEDQPSGAERVVSWVWRTLTNRREFVMTPEQVTEYNGGTYANAAVHAATIANAAAEEAPEAEIFYLRGGK